MKIYVVIEDVDDWPENGGGEYPVAIFLNYANADKYATRKKIQANTRNKTYVYYRVETWETFDEKMDERRN